MRRRRDGSQIWKEGTQGNVCRKKATEKRDESFILVAQLW